MTYYLTLTDTQSNTWNGSVLAFRQNGVYQTFGFTTAIASSDPMSFIFDKYTTVDVIVSTIGVATDEVGFDIRNSAGTIIFQRSPGTVFFANTLLGSFCPECLNLSPVSIVGIEESRDIEQTTVEPADTAQLNSYKVSTFVMAPLLLLFIVATALASTKVVMLSKKLKEQQTAGDDKQSNLNEKVGSSIKNPSEINLNL